MNILFITQFSQLTDIYTVTLYSIILNTCTTFQYKRYNTDGPLNPLSDTVPESVYSCFHYNWTDCQLGIE